MTRRTSTEHATAGEWLVEQALDMLLPENFTGAEGRAATTTPYKHRITDGLRRGNLVGGLPLVVNTGCSHPRRIIH